MANTSPARSVVPKAELHVHVEGAASGDLVRRLAKRHRIDLEDLFGEDGSYEWDDFAGFLSAYDRASSVFRTPQDFALLSETYLRSLAAEGTIYAELTISPDHAAAAGLSYPDYVAGLAEGIGRAQVESGIEARMIAVGVRHFGARAVEQETNWRRHYLAHYVRAVEAGSNCRPMSLPTTWPSTVTSPFSDNSVTSRSSLFSPARRAVVLRSTKRNVSAA